MNKNKRTRDAIEYEQYGFDFQREIRIFFYLYGMRMDRKSRKKLKDEDKYSCYKDWRMHVQKQYEDFDIEKLENFHRYLTQRKRCNKPKKEYLNILVTVSLTITVTFYITIFEKFQDMEFPMMIVSWILIMAGYAYIIYITITPFFENNAEEIMLMDIIEIIDEIIKDKKKEQKKILKKKHKKHK